MRNARIIHGRRRRGKPARHLAVRSTTQTTTASRLPGEMSLRGSLARHGNPHTDVHAREPSSVQPSVQPHRLPSAVGVVLVTTAAAARAHGKPLLFDRLSRSVCVCARCGNEFGVLVDCRVVYAHFSPGGSSRCFFPPRSRLFVAVSIHTHPFIYTSK